MYAILGEDDSDVDMLKVLVRRISKEENTKIKTKGFVGCGELLSKGARQIRAYRDLGFTRFIICYDSDRSPAHRRHAAIVDRVIRESSVAGEFCAIVPVQEIESWILADLPAISQIITSWRPSTVFASPENQANPKEFLEGMCRHIRTKPLYDHVVHNPIVAKHLNLAEIVKKCPSALPLFEFIYGFGGNHPPPEYPPDKVRRNRILEALAA